MISFIIPAHNEARLIGRTVQSIHRALQAVGEPYEIVVVDDASTDTTAAIAREQGARVITVQHRQIAATRNAGVREARGDILFFVDADTIANRLAVTASLKALRRGAVGGGCVFRFLGAQPLWVRILHPIGIAAARRIRLVGGCFLFCSRAAFTAVGGFCEQQYAGEEIVFLRALKRHGSVVVPPPLVETSDRKLHLLTMKESLRLLVRFALQGTRSFRQRAGLEIWYGNREAQDRVAYGEP